MKIEYLGEEHLEDGDAELAIVAGIHGNEPSGVEAMRRLHDDLDLEVNRPVKLITANERALAEGVRYIDVDLNREFDESVPDNAHERELSRQLASELSNTTVLTLHSTKSTDEPFVLTTDLADTTRQICAHLSIDKLILAEDLLSGRSFAADANLIELEAGHHDTQATVENSFRIMLEFLTITGALPGDTVASDVAVYQHTGSIEKPEAAEYDFLAENFERVDPGDIIAEADGKSIKANETFWPIVASADGYEEIFGYKSQLIDNSTVTL